MRRLTRSELASRVGPRPPSDAFWRRAIDRGAAALGVGPDAVAAAATNGGTDGGSEPLDTGDIVDVGDHAFVVVAADPTDAGGRTYRIELVSDRGAD